MWRRGRACLASACQPQGREVQLAGQDEGLNIDSVVCVSDYSTVAGFGASEGRHQGMRVMGGDSLAGERVRYVLRGRCVTEDEARAQVAAGAVVCVVPQLHGGGGGASVSCLRMYVLFVPVECVCVLAFEHMYVCIHVHIVIYMCACIYVYVYICIYLLHVK